MYNQVNAIINVYSEYTMTGSWYGTLANDCKLINVGIATHSAY